MRSTFPEIRHRELYGLWRSLCREFGRPPPRSAFDPLDVPKVMSSMIFVEVVPDDYRFRVVGTDMVDAWGMDFTGRHLSEIMTGQYHDFIRGLFDQTTETGQAIYSHSQFRWDTGRKLNTKRLMVPFRKDEEEIGVGFVLVSQTFDYTTPGPDQPSVMPESEFEIIELVREVISER